MNIVFLGSSTFAIPALESLIHDKSYSIVAVYTQPPRPRGRGYAVQKCPVHIFAETHGIKVYTPQTLRSQEEQNIFVSHQADLAVVASYGLILPKAILEIPRLGCWNIHASLLPRWRGASPIQQSLLAGDKETGITIMQMDEGLDTGAMLSQWAMSLTAETTYSYLHDTLAEWGGRQLIQTLKDFRLIQPVPQPQKGVTLAPKIQKSDAELIWTESCDVLERKVRALNPMPGTYFKLGEMSIRVLAAQCQASHGSALSGTVIDCEKGYKGIVCSQGVFVPTLLQRPGGKSLNAPDFFRGFSLPSNL
jgi:methionyl-tRNA formyltransferase